MLKSFVDRSFWNGIREITIRNRRPTAPDWPAALLGPAGDRSIDSIWSNDRLIRFDTVIDRLIRFDTVIDRSIRFDPVIDRLIRFDTVIDRLIRWSDYSIDSIANGIVCGAEALRHGAQANRHHVWLNGRLKVIRSIGLLIDSIDHWSITSWGRALDRLMRRCFLQENWEIRLNFF